MSQFPEQPRQQSSYDQGNYNFAQGSPDQYDFGLGNQMPQEIPQKRNNTRRTLFLGCGCVTTAIIIVCGCLFGIMYTSREAIPALMWIQMASGESPLDLDDAADFNVVCQGSQAEAFTQRFQERYPGEVMFELDQNTMIFEGETTNTVGFEGVMLYQGEELDYEATFFLDPDGESIIFFLGCIERIEQISPPLSVELPSDDTEPERTPAPTDDTNNGVTEDDTTLPDNAPDDEAQNE
jgi:hypothetical protein